MVEMIANEFEPYGPALDEPGAKADGGKVELDLVMEGFARALWAVGEVATYGARKYTRNGWMNVPDGGRRYTAAMYRHLALEAMGEWADEESDLAHAAHAAWNALARLELTLRYQEEARRPSGTRYGGRDGSSGGGSSWVFELLDEQPAE